MELKRNGGITFWRIGRFGGSFYRARKPVSLGAGIYGRITGRTFCEMLYTYQPPCEPNPYVAGYRIIGAVAAMFFVLWLLVGVESGFIP